MPDERLTATGKPLTGNPRRNSPDCDAMTALLVTFLLGIANFALHKAVLESRHPVLGRLPFMSALGPRASLGAEFVVLLGAMLLVGSGSIAWAWAYFGYTAFNAVAAWLILTRRI